MARRESTLTQMRMLELFDYDTTTGDLVWKGSYSNRIKNGDIAGCVAGNGRKYAGVDGMHYMVHRLVWLHQKGAWPRYNLAPVDGDYLNTRIENLVEQTPSQTVKKVELRSNNKTGIKGVTWDESKKEYAVYAYVDGKSLFHSRHKSLEAATEASKEALQGIVPTAEERKARHDRMIERRRLWARMVKWCKGLHRWESVEQFLGDVGDPPHQDSRLIQVDFQKALGPGNFMWTEFGVDHRTKEAKQAAKKRLENRDKYRHGHLMRKFGISNERYIAMLLEQKGVCAICGNPETEIDEESGRVAELQVDHNHTTKAVRSLLCLGCNTGIGNMKEDVERMKSAIRYLNRWNGIEQPDNVVPLTSTLAFGA